MVSIIIPVYNVEQYIGECLESILNQRYKDYELIIIDDGSTDKSLDIIYNYKNKFENILILKQENKGVSEARNLAMNYVNGKYVIYIDSDDFLDENMLEILVARSEKFNADITICEYYFYYSENSNKNRIQKYDVDEERVYEKDEVIKYMLEDKLQGQLWHKLFKTDLLKATNFTFESGRYIQDIFPVFKAISNCNRIVFVKKPLYYYRQRYTSTVYKKDMKIADDFFFASKSIMNYIKSNNIIIDKESFKKFCSITLIKFIGYYVQADNENNEKSFKKSKYSCLKVNFFDIFFKKNIDFNIKIKVLLWNIGIYSKVRTLKRAVLN